MICIPDSKEEAMKDAVTNRSEATLFSDGSGYEGAIGMAAVLYRGSVEKKATKKFMGSEDRHTVFKAELLGMSMAVELIKDKRQIRTLTLGIDSQAALCAISNRRATPGQYLVDSFHKQIEAVRCKHPGIEIMLRWMPGHLGITGNERADREAKWVAKGELSEQRRLPVVCTGDLLTSRLAARQCHRKQISDKTRKWFESSPICYRLWLIDPSMPSLRFKKDTQGMERWKTSLVIQLRTGHILLQVHLKRIGKTNSPICTRCHKAEETVEHYLTECKAFATHRGRMERQL